MHHLGYHVRIQASRNALSGCKLPTCYIIGIIINKIVFVFATALPLQAHPQIPQTCRRAFV